MKINISDILRDGFSEKELNFEKETDGVKVAFNGVLKNINGIIELNGKMELSYGGICGRCLREASETLSTDVRESIINAETMKDTEEYAYEGKVLDLGEIINDYIYLNEPAKMLCRDECRGICTKCGADLNESQCECSTDEIKPELEILKDYFTKKE